MGLLLALVCLIVPTFAQQRAPKFVNGKQQENSGSNEGSWIADPFAAIADALLENSVVVFSKSYCPYCKRAKALLQDQNVQFYAVEMDQIPGGAGVQQALKEKTGQRTVPNVFIGGEHIGGYDALSSLVKQQPQQFADKVKAAQSRA